MKTISMPYKDYNEELFEAKKKSQRDGYILGWSALCSILVSEMNGMRVFEEYRIPENLDPMTARTLVEHLRLNPALGSKLVNK